MINSGRIVKIFGITKDSKTSDFIMVMQYVENGSLRQKLNKNFNSLSWEDKLDILSDIAFGLNDIHKKGLTHQDFHSGNILNKPGIAFITDLGLCKPADEETEKHNKNVYGVLPYVAPEVLRGKTYTQASDVYGFGIIIYEVFNGLPPYHDMAHEDLLALKICQGFRPKFNIKVPQLIENIAKQCVDTDQLKRPTTNYLVEKLNQCLNEVDKFNKGQPSSKNLLYNVQSFFHESGGCLVQSILYFEFGKVKTQQKENHE